MRIMIAEDEEKLADALVQIFAKNKMTADAFGNGIDALDNALTGIYDVIVLDIMMPGMNGIEVLRKIRAEGIDTPVLMFTAKDEISDKVKGLDSGADDYLTKPFATEELLARVRALGRRSSAAIVNSDVITCGDLSLDTAAYELSCGKNSLKLGLKEFSIMELLMKNSGRVLSKETLITKIWGYDSDAEYNNVEVYISFLRKKLDFIKSKAAIKTVRGVGYTLEEDEAV
ncbi:MAG: response regulator transcription factor [Oscillospiraceae bacterium]|nr:response regulator transcription factor [Oscillospiraceae bacterium]MDD7279725.1 response regulator transcription factor [Oscillospiraceae bacterium]MDY2864218.1 response regulator transcription factor [Oscillospiraceae bacterium]